MFTLALDGPERELLFELKTLHAGPGTYGDVQHRGDAVARRARRLPAEYAAKARKRIGISGPGCSYAADDPGAGSGSLPRRRNI